MQVGAEGATYHHFMSQIHVKIILPIFTLSHTYLCYLTHTYSEHTLYTGDQRKAVFWLRGVALRLPPRTADRPYRTKSINCVSFHQMEHSPVKHHDHDYSTNVLGRFAETRN